MNWKYTLSIVAFIIVWMFVVAFYGVVSSILPKRHVSMASPAEFNISFEDVTLTTEDGIKLSAWFMPNNKTEKAVIICHGYPFDKGNVITLMPFLHKKYNVLMFDFRAMGKSSGSYTTGGYHETKDLDAAVEYLKKRSITSIGVLGVSLGGSVAIITAEQNNDIKAVVADAPTASLDYVVNGMYRQFSIFRAPFVLMSKVIVKMFFRFDISKVSAVQSVKQMKAPLLIIHGTLDDQVSVEESKMIYGAANEPKEIWIVEGAGHVASHVVMEKKYEEKVLKFFGKYLT